MENLSLISYSLSLKNIWAKKRFTYATAEYAELNRIALLTANDGGPAVYNARVMLSINPAYMQRRNETRNNPPAIGIDSLQNIIVGEPYPNPSSGEVFLNYSLNNEDKVYFELYSINGQLLSRQQLEARSILIVINTKDYTEGIYFYKVRTDEKTIKSGKLAIMK